MSGPMAESSVVNGKTTKWRVKAFSHGLMAEDMKESISMIRKKVTVSSTGNTLYPC